MLKNERQQEILNMLRGAGFVSVQQLSEALYTSPSTIRRILADMEKENLVLRSYGGAELRERHSNVVAFTARAGHNMTAKKEIAQKAAELVPEGGIIFLDQSSTATYLAAELAKKKELTVVTNNVEILRLLAETNFSVRASGGHLSQQNRMCLIGVDACKSFERINADIAFFSARALSVDGVISDCTMEEIHVRNAMLSNAERRVFLCDSEKFGARSAYRQCALSDLDVLISEGESARGFGPAHPRLLTL